MQHNNIRRECLGFHIARFFMARLYEFFENHSSSRTVQIVSEVCALEHVFFISLTATEISI